MILDTVANWKRYSWPSARFETAFKFLEHMQEGLRDGRITLDDEGTYCSIQTYETKPRETVKFEAHRKYADIQILLEGTESLLWAPLEGLAAIDPYDHQRDMAKYALTPDATDVVLTPGQFCVLFPQDAHTPSIERGEKSTVRKIVVKVPLD